MTPGAARCSASRSRRVSDCVSRARIGSPVLVRAERLRRLNPACVMCCAILIVRHWCADCRARQVNEEEAQANAETSDYRVSILPMQLPLTPARAQKLHVWIGKGLAQLIPEPMRLHRDRWL